MDYPSVSAGAHLRARVAAWENVAPGKSFSPRQNLRFRCGKPDSIRPNRASPPDAKAEDNGPAAAGTAAAFPPTS
jgi:hypothetical protein